MQELEPKSMSLKLPSLPSPDATILIFCGVPVAGLMKTDIPLMALLTTLGNGGTRANPLLSVNVVTEGGLKVCAYV